MFEVFILWSPIHEQLIIPLEKITTTTGFIAVFCFMNFTFIILNKERNIFYFVFSFILASSIYVNIFTDLYFYGYEKYYWGISLKTGELFFAIVFGVYFLPMAYTFLILYRRIREDININTKNQLLLLFYGMALFFIISILSDIILPHIFSMKDIMRIGIPCGAIQSIFVFVAVKKYNFLSISFEEISKALFINLQDGIILLDKNQSILQINNYARHLFGLGDSIAYSLRIEDFIPGYGFSKQYKNHEININICRTDKVISISQANVKQYSLDVGKILIARDITESKQFQQALHDTKINLEKLANELAATNTSLEQKVAERTMSLQISNAQLQREIGERKRAEAALAAEKERLAVTLRSIGDGVITTDTSGIIGLLHQAAEQLTGWSHEEALGRPLVSVFPLLDEKTRQPCLSPVSEVLHAQHGVTQVHHRLLRVRDGTERIIAKHGTPIRDKEGCVLGMVLVFRDMTEKRRIEEELIKAHKLESVGALAGGIAHDFNNILTAVIGNLSLARLHTSSDDTIASLLTNAENAALRAQNLTRQFLTFAKGGSPVRKVSSLKDLIEESVNFSLAGSKTVCTLDFADNLSPAYVDEGQMIQVINNLIINADQAMSHGGTIKVSVANIHINANDEERYFPLPYGDYIKISVKDHGVGIAEECRHKIFDPYFTTKEKGSGLGLFTSYSIIKKHDGHIAVDSALGVGTTFHLYLPAVQGHPAPGADTHDVPGIGTGRVLIMDDEEGIRAVTGAMLRRCGYEVDFARNGQEAIALYAEAHEARQSFAAIIMDLTIPGGMGGKEALHIILQQDPQARAMVVSGYSNDPIMAEYSRYGFRGCLVKPYQFDDLLRVLQQVIGVRETSHEA